MRRLPLLRAEIESRFLLFLQPEHIRRNLGTHERFSKATPAKPPVVRRWRQTGVLLPQLAQGPWDAARHVRRSPSDWHLQHLVGTHALQQLISRARRTRQAWCLRGRWFSAGIPSDV